MILNESKNKYKTFHIHQDNWYEHGNSVAFYTERNDGTRLSKPIYIPKSQIIKDDTNSMGITTFRISDWILRQKLLRGYRLTEW